MFLQLTVQFFKANKSEPKIIKLNPLEKFFFISIKLNSDNWVPQLTFFFFTNI